MNKEIEWGKWERDSTWWWGFSDYVIGITWMGNDNFQIRGILFGPIQIYWERWNKDLE